MSKFTHHQKRLAAQFKGESGQALMEYALVLALVAIVSIGVMKALGVDIHNVLDQTSSSMASVPNP
jgi:Flp pilus assembly pilin Flp